MSMDVFAFLNSITPLAEEIKIRLNSILRTRTVKKKEYLLKEEEICNNIYFIEKGLVRVFYIKDGLEWCSGLLAEGGVCVSVHSFFDRVKSYEYIQAIEETIVQYHTFEDLEEMYRDFIEYNIIGRKLITEYYVRSEERNFWLRKHTAIEKYQLFNKKFSDIIGRIPVKDIASYLGMEIETLSRLRRRI